MNRLTNVRAAGFHVDGVERLAGGHEQAVAFGSAKADVSADFGQQNLPDAFVMCIGLMMTGVSLGVIRPDRIVGLTKLADERFGSGRWVRLISADLTASPDSACEGDFATGTASDQH